MVATGGTNESALNATEFGTSTENNHYEEQVESGEEEGEEEYEEINQQEDEDDSQEIVSIENNSVFRNSFSINSLNSRLRTR